ncbi:hypothetical protein D3C86_2095320 [compost metagenome]
MRQTPEARPPQFDSSPLRRVLSHLHFIRSSLLDPDSPLASHAALTGSPAHAA